ncbi:MAG: CRISPR-associated protein Cas4 [Candidatus Thermoplasmatota archaeon]
MIKKRDKITGVMVQYYKTCKRELWFFSHNINLNYEDENIKIGRQIQESSYFRKKKELRLGTIALDVVEKNGDICIYEIKKSSKLEEPSKYQLYYYQWFLRKKGVKARAFLVYPTERKKEELKLNKKIVEELEEIVEKIKNIVFKDTPPPPKRRPYCNECSYYEFCWV